MKKRLFLLYLFLCMALPSQAGWKDGFFRLISKRSLPRSSSQAVVLAEDAAAKNIEKTLPGITTSATNALLGSIEKTTQQVVGAPLQQSAPGMGSAFPTGSAQNSEKGFLPPVSTETFSNVTPTTPLSAAMPDSSPMVMPGIPAVGENIAKMSAWKAYSVLDQTATETYEEARLAVNESPYRPIMGEPVTFNHKVSAFPMRGKDVYPDKPFLHKPVIGPFLTEAYFLAESNRLLLKHLKEVEEFWPAFYGATERFYAEADETTERFHKETGGTDQSDEAKLLSWAYNQIPENTQNLLLGEIHGYREIPQFVIDLLEKIATTQPAGRKIFLFTEFLPNTNSRGHLLGGLLDCPYESYYSHVWRKARQAGIEVVGLEDKYIRSNPNTVKASFGNYTVKIPEWGTMAGMQKRNDTWAKLIKQYRDENPDALFIVYAGAGHLLYNYPFTLAKRFAKENTFFLNIIPDEVYEGGEIIYKTDPLEELNPNMSFPHLAIKWQSPDLVQLSGYDARVRLPIDIKAKREDMANWGVSGLSITPLPGGSELP